MRYSFPSKQCHGFTLAEVMIVLVIMCIAAVVGVSSYMGFIHHSAEASCSNTAVGFLDEAERSIAVRQFVGQYDAEEYFLSLLQHNSVSDSSLVSSDEERSAAYRTSTGEHYAVTWHISDICMTVSLSCEEHETEYTRDIRLFYIDSASYK